MDKSTTNILNKKMDHQSSKILLLQLLVLVTFISTVNCDIRCHCNQPACVRTSYMCKSTGPQAGCFVEQGFGFNGEQAISRHGCIEMLPIEQRTPCLEQALESFAASQSTDSPAKQQHHRHGHRMGPSSSSSGAASQPQRPSKSIMCCLDDMCNYIKNEDPSEFGSNSRHHSRNHNHHRDSSQNRLESSNSGDMDELGRQLQQDFKRGLSNYESQSTLIFGMIVFGLILIMFIFLVLMVLFGMRCIRQQNPQHMKQTQLSTVDCGSFGPAKKSMLDWRCFKPVKGQGSPNSYDSSRSFNNSMYTNAKSMTHQQYQNQKQAKHSLLLSVKVDVDSQGLTKLENEDFSNSPHQQDVASNLPNIISAHMMSEQQQQQPEPEPELDNRAPMMNAPKFGRERQNSIYLSLLPSAPTLSQQQLQQQSQTERGQPNPNFDLIN